MHVAFFSPSSLFGGDDDDDNGTNGASGLVCPGKNECIVTYVQRTHAFPRMYCWSLLATYAKLGGEEKGYLSSLFFQSGTGALAIFLAKLRQLDITTSDFYDLDIGDNVAHNCQINEFPLLPHIQHEKQYQNLIKTVISPETESIQAEG